MYIIKQPKEVMLAVDIINKLSDKPITSKELSDSLAEGQAFIQRIIYKLGKAGLVKVVRGPGGGVVWADVNTVGELNLGQIYLALGRVSESNATTPGEMTSAFLLSFLSKTPVFMPPERGYGAEMPEELQTGPVNAS